MSLVRRLIVNPYRKWRDPELYELNSMSWRALSDHFAKAAIEACDYHRKYSHSLQNCIMNTDALRTTASRIIPILQGKESTRYKGHASNRIHPAMYDLNDPAMTFAQEILKYGHSNRFSVVDVPNRGGLPYSTRESSAISILLDEGTDVGVLFLHPATGPRNNIKMAITMVLDDGHFVDRKTVLAAWLDFCGLNIFLPNGAEADVIQNAWFSVQEREIQKEEEKAQRSIEDANIKAMKALGVHKDIT